MKKDKEGVWIISEKEAEVLNIGEKKEHEKRKQSTGIIPVWI